MITKLLDWLTNFTKTKLKIDMSRRPYIGGGLLGIIIGLLIFLFYTFGTFTKLNLMLSDTLIKTFSNAEQASDDIILLVIGQESLNQADKRMKMGWPWKRATYGKVCDYLRLSGAKVLAFDMFFTETSAYSDKEKNDDAIFGNAVKKIEKSYVGASVRGFIQEGINLSRSKTISVATSEAYKSSVRVEQVDSTIKIVKFKKLILPTDLFTESFSKIGLLSAWADPDGVYRSLITVANHNNFHYPTLPFIIASDLLSWDAFTYKRHALFTGDRKIPLYDEGISMRIKFYGSNNLINRAYDNYEIIHTIILFDILNDFYNGKVKLPDITPPSSLNELYADANWTSKILDAIAQDENLMTKYRLNEKLIKELKAVSPDHFKDKIVFIGGAAQGLKDTKPNPMAKNDPGIILHATALDNILQNDFITVIDARWTILLMTLCLTFLLGILGTIFSFLRALIAFFVIFFTLAGAYIILYVNFNILFDAVTPALGIVISFFTVEYLMFLMENKQKSYIKNAFGQYLSPKVIEILMDDPSKLSLGGELKEMTAVFTDLARFSSISELLTASELVYFLNEYLTEMCDIIAEYDGTIDKFEGDAIIAFWGAPIDIEDHAKRACLAMIKMQKRMIELRNEWVKIGMPPLFMRIGINTGKMVVGNMGSKTRMDYTIMGDSVNLAARLEGVNKFYGTSILCSNNTYDQVKDHIEAKEIDIIRVVGRQEAVTIYEVIDEKGKLNAQLKNAIQLHNVAIDLYRNREYNNAISKFEEMLKIVPDDNVANTYIERCKFYLQHPPADNWDGVFIMESK